MRSAPWPVLMLLLAAGCGRSEEVQRYKAPKDPLWRMVGAIVPGKEATWFFKVAAPADRISHHKDGVVAFLKQLRIEDNDLRWTLPPGWKQEQGGPARVASFKFGDRDPKLEMTVVRLPGDGGGLAANVNRWRDQLGLDRAAESEVAAMLQKVPAAGLDVQIVDLVGPSRPTMGGGRPMARQQPEPQARSGDSQLDTVRSMFTFERPPAWRENPQPANQRVFEFAVEEGGAGALVTFTIMGGEGGGLAANIDRWRTQAGLEALGEQAIARSATPMKFVGTEAWLVDVAGSDTAILGVIALNPQFSMFLKMTGPPSVVNAQRATFMRVAQSFQMKGRSE